MYACSVCVRVCVCVCVYTTAVERRQRKSNRKVRLYLRSALLSSRRSRGLRAQHCGKRRSPAAISAVNFNGGLSKKEEPQRERKRNSGRNENKYTFPLFSSLLFSSLLSLSLLSSVSLCAAASVVFTQMCLLPPPTPPRLIPRALLATL